MKLACLMSKQITFASKEYVLLFSVFTKVYQTRYISVLYFFAFYSGAFRRGLKYKQNHIHFYWLDLQW